MFCLWAATHHLICKCKPEICVLSLCYLWLHVILVGFLETLETLAGFRFLLLLLSFLFLSPLPFPHSQLPWSFLITLSSLKSLPSDVTCMATFWSQYICLNIYIYIGWLGGISYVVQCIQACRVKTISYSHCCFSLCFALYSFIIYACPQNSINTILKLPSTLNWNLMEVLQISMFGPHNFRDEKAMFISHKISHKSLNSSFILSWMWTEHSNFSIWFFYSPSLFRSTWETVFDSWFSPVRLGTAVACEFVITLQKAPCSEEWMGGG